MRFLRARQFSVEKSFTMLQDDVIWRLKNEVQGYLQRSPMDILQFADAKVPLTPEELLKTVKAHLPIWQSGVCKQVHCVNSLHLYVCCPFVRPFVVCLLPHLSIGFSAI